MAQHSQHIAAYVYACFDPSIRDALAQILDERFGKGAYFLDLDPGAVMNLVSPTKESDRGFVLRKMNAAAKLHPFDTVVLINHSNCGAYKLAGKTFDGKSEEEAFHKSELEKAVAVVREAMPDTNIEVHYFLKDEQRMAW